MKILTRYTLRCFIRYQFLATGTFVGLYLLVDFFDKIDNFIEHRAPLEHYVGYFSSIIPGVVSQMMPLATLLAVFLTLGGFNRTSELTAMMAGGLSIRRIVQPLLAAGILISLLILLNNEFVVPWTARHANHVLRVEVKGKPELFTTRGKLWFRQGDSYINARFFNAEKELLEGVRVFAFAADGSLLQRLDAENATYDAAVSRWQLQNYAEYRFRDNGRFVADFSTGHRRAVDLGKTPEELKTVEPQTEEMTFSQLRRFVARLEAEGFDPGHYRVAMHQHLAAPFAVFVMVMLGIPFALKRGRNSGMTIGIGMSIAVGVAYFVINATIVAFGASGKFPPLAAAWAANLLFVLLATVLLLRRRI